MLHILPKGDATTKRAKCEPATTKVEPDTVKSETATVKKEPAVVKSEPAAVKSEPAVVKSQTRSPKVEKKRKIEADAIAAMKTEATEGADAKKTEKKVGPYYLSNQSNISPKTFFQRHFGKSEILKYVIKKLSTPTPSLNRRFEYVQTQFHP